jgi:hypothetical protein
MSLAFGKVLELGTSISTMFCITKGKVKYEAKLSCSTIFPSYRTGNDGPVVWVSFGKPK